MSVVDDQQLDRGRVTRGASFLASRQLISIAMSATSAVLLSRWLTPAEYGLFAQLTFWTFGAAALLVGDLGLALALVRMQREPTARQWAGALTLMFALLLAGIVLTACAVIALAFTGNQQLALFIAVLGVATSLRFSRAVPSARLQRDHRFGVIAVAELTQSILYFGSAIILAGLGAGVAALVAGAVVSEIVGTTWFWIAARMRPRISISALKETKPLLKVGIPVQGTGLLVGVTDAFQPVFIGAVLGATTLGYVSWAYSIALVPLMVLASLDRVIVPVVARFQSDDHTVSRWTERSIRLNCLVALPVVIVLATNVESIITYVFAPQWLPAAPLVLAFLPAIVATALSAPITQAFNAKGQTKIGFRLSMVWAALTWTVGAASVLVWGVSGYGWFYVAIQMTYLPLWYAAWRMLRVRVWVPSAYPLLMAAITVGLMLLVPTPGGFVELVGHCLLAVALFGVLVSVSDIHKAKLDLALAREMLSRGSKTPEQ